MFGDLNDKQSRVATAATAERAALRLLEELQTQPRTSYLAAVRNPNPEMPGGAGPNHG